MRRLFVCSVPLLLLLFPLPAETEYKQLIENLTENLGRLGSWKMGEIEIASSPAEIRRIEKACEQRLLRQGYSKKEANSYSHTGIVAEDHYWIWVRDAVTFPGGIPGTYDRLIWKSGLSGPSGVVILPVLSSGKVMVNVNFRHATRAWELELPRGGRKENETPEQAAVRELREETGCIASQLISLGTLAPESGVVSGVVPVFFGKVKEQKKRSQEEGEAIGTNQAMSLDELREAILKGYITIDLKGTKTKVYCRDPVLSYALLQAIWRKLL